MSLGTAATITITQIGNNVEVVGSGRLNLTALTESGGGAYFGNIQPSAGIIITGDAALTELDYYIGITEGETFGSEAIFVANFGSGDKFGIIHGSWGVNGVDDFFGPYLVVPNGYNGEDLSATSIYEDQSIASLKLNEGTYTWNWGSGSTAGSLTLIIGTVVPEPATYAAIFGAAIAGFALIKRRRKNC